MGKQIIDEAVKHLDGFPESRISSSLDSIEFLKQDEFTEEEKKILPQSASKENSTPGENIRQNA